MIRRLIILLLIVGCDKNSTEPEVHPLVGSWMQIFSAAIEDNTTIGTVIGPPFLFTINNDGTAMQESLSSTSWSEYTWEMSNNIPQFTLIRYYPITNPCNPDIHWNCPPGIDSSKIVYTYLEFETYFYSLLEDTLKIAKRLIGETYENNPDIYQRQ